MFTRVYTYKLRPNRKQRENLATTLELCRNLYNCALEQRRMHRISMYEQKRQLAELKEAFAENRTIHAHIVQNVIFRLDHSFQNFFRRAKNGQKPGFPRFKSRDRHDSFEFNNTGFSLDGNYLRISKIGKVRLHLSRPIKGKIKQCRILRRVDGWFGQCVVEIDGQPLPANRDAVGIDLGVENFAAPSNGEFLENPTFYEKAQQELRWAQRRVARRNRILTAVRKRSSFSAGSPAGCEQAAQLSAPGVEETGQSFRSGRLREPQYPGVSREGFLAKQVSEAGWSTCLRLLSYKAEEAGRVGSRSELFPCKSDVPKVRKNQREAARKTLASVRLWIHCASRYCSGSCDFGSGSPIRR